jgi:hypothetical protein
MSGLVAKSHGNVRSEVMSKGKRTPIVTGMGFLLFFAGAVLYEFKSGTEFLNDYQIIGLVGMIGGGIIFLVGLLVTLRWHIRKKTSNDTLKYGRFDKK